MQDTYTNSSITSYLWIDYSCSNDTTLYKYYYVIAHIHGYQNHKTGDESRNSWIANLATMGEGWHNNLILK